MSNKYTLEEVREIVRKYGFELVSKVYVNNKEKLILKDKYGYLYAIKLDHIFRDSNHKPFHIRNPYAIHNIKLWCKLNNKPFELLSDKHVGTLLNLKWKCLKDGCGEEFEMRWADIQNGHGCSFCRGLQVGLSNCLATKNPELATEWHPTKNGNLTPYDVTCGSHKYVWWKCKKCGHEWYNFIGDMHVKNRGCPKCNKSKGENKIEEVLNTNNFIEILQKQYNKLNNIEKVKNNYYISQKEFNGLIGLGNGNLSYDFYIPKLNLLIEYQGEQHEKYIPGFHKSKKDFLKQVKHDKRKREYAKIHNIKLLEIWYWDFNNIEEILIKQLNINKFDDSENTVVNL